jgi:hypothetical protein
MKSRKNRFLMKEFIKVQFQRLDRRGLLNWVPDRVYLKNKFNLILGYKLNLNEPKSFNEKLQWLKIHDRKSEYSSLVDKYEVRKFISETIGEEYLIPLLGVYNDYDEIDFETLPNQFVLKPNHTSGDIYICKDKKEVDTTQLKREVKKWLKRQYYKVHREWPYKNIKPKIVCEKFMIDESGELRDYKFMCFNGKVKCMFVGRNRNSDIGLQIDFYDLDWNIMPFERHYPSSGILIQKPKTFDKMVEFAEKLSQDIPFVRVDFYEAGEKLYFGELTFFPGSGFEEFTPISYDYLLGSWMNIPLKTKLDFES